MAADGKHSVPQVASRLCDNQNNPQEKGKKIRKIVTVLF